MHAVLQTAQIPTAVKFGLLAWASSVCLAGQYTPAPVATPPPPLANKGMWTPDQLRPLLGRSVLPVRSRPASTPGPQPPRSPCCRPASRTPPAPLPSPRPATRPTSPRATQPAAPLGPCLRRLHSPRRQPCTGPRARPPLQGQIIRPHRCCPSRLGSPSASPNLPPKCSQLPPTPRRWSRLPQPPDQPPPAPPSRGSPLSRTSTCRLNPPTTPSCVSGMRPSNRSWPWRKGT